MHKYEVFRRSLFFWPTAVFCTARSSLGLWIGILLMAMQRQIETLDQRWAYNYTCIYCVVLVFEWNGCMAWTFLFSRHNYNVFMLIFVWYVCDNSFTPDIMLQMQMRTWHGCWNFCVILWITMFCVSARY